MSAWKKYYLIWLIGFLCMGFFYFVFSSFPGATLVLFSIHSHTSGGSFDITFHGLVNFIFLAHIIYLIIVSWHNYKHTVDISHATTVRRK